MQANFLSSVLRLQDLLETNSSRGSTLPHPRNLAATFQAHKICFCQTEIKVETFAQTIDSPKRRASLEGEHSESVVMATYTDHGSNFRNGSIRKVAARLMGEDRQYTQDPKSIDTTLEIGERIS